MRILLYSFCFAICIALTSFMLLGGNETPKEVALQFLNAQKKSDFKTAKKFATEETQSLLDMAEVLSENIPDSIKQKESNAKIVVLSETINGNKCTVTYLNSTNPDIQTIYLLKQNEKWLVSQSKDPEKDDASFNTKTIENFNSIPLSTEPDKRITSEAENIVAPYLEKLSPVQVAKLYLDYSKSLNIEKAKKYATPELQGLLNFSASVQQSKEEIQAQLKSINTNFKIVSQTEDVCIIKYTNTLSGEASEKTIQLALIKGKWLVGLNKEPSNKE